MTTLITLPVSVRDAIDIALLALALTFAIDVAGVLERHDAAARVRQFAVRRRLAMLVVGSAACVGCVLVAALFHEPVPRIHDEFMHLVLSNTLAIGHVATPTPPLPEFFDTFHVLERPVYASKAFPTQGALLAIGERLTGHPIVGVWLSSALAVAATCWMLQAWIGPAWALVGGLLMVVQVGVFSYWSQSYWGGMVGALGGALLFGAARRLWRRVTATDASLFAVGLVLVILSRPLEGPLAVLPVAALLGHRMWRQARWRERGFWRRVAPAGAIVIVSIATMAAYDRAITGSAWKPPYALHEEQYQESPPAAFLALRPKITYSSEWLRYYYEVQEMELYTSKRTLGAWLQAARSTLTEWWVFYCGVLLSAPLVLPVLLRKNWMAYAQGALLVGWVGVLLARASWPVGAAYVFDVLVVLQAALLWMALDGLWPRLALGIVAVLLVASLFAKWARPHYFAPAACLILFLQVDGLRRLWRRPAHLITDTDDRIRPWWGRGFVVLLTAACALSLCIHVVGRLRGVNWQEDGATGNLFAAGDWSVHRADLEKWLEAQPAPELVFVRYSEHHNVNAEWVYNHADLVHAHVVWARDLGDDRNRALTTLMQGRTTWLLEADVMNPALRPYPAPEPGRVTVAANDAHASSGHLPW